MIRMPPQGFDFNSAEYASSDHELNAEYQEEGEHLRNLYPELKNWPNWAIFTAWMECGEALDYLSNPILPATREDRFIAYLYAEQILNKGGYFFREDGVRFTHYDIDRLDEYWAKYDADKQA